VIVSPGPGPNIGGRVYDRRPLDAQPVAPLCHPMYSIATIQLTHSLTLPSGPVAPLCVTHCLWPPYGIGQAVIFSSCEFLLSVFFRLLLLSLPILSRHRSDVYHTSTDSVALVRI